MNTLGVSVSNQQLFHRGDFVQVGGEALLLPTAISFHVHAIKPGVRILAIMPIKTITFGWGEDLGDQGSALSLVVLHLIQTL